MFVFYIVMYVSFVYLSTSLLYVHCTCFLAHIYVDLIVSATNVLVVFLSTINKHFLLLLLTDLPKVQDRVLFGAFRVIAQVRVIPSESEGV